MAQVSVNRNSHVFKQDYALWLVRYEHDQTMTIQRRLLEQLQTTIVFAKLFELDSFVHSVDDRSKDIADDLYFQTVYLMQPRPQVCSMRFLIKQFCNVA